MFQLFWLLRDNRIGYFYFNIYTPTNTLEINKKANTGPKNALKSEDFAHIGVKRQEKK